MLEKFIRWGKKRLRRSTVARRLAKIVMPRPYSAFDLERALGDSKALGRMDVALTALDRKALAERRIFFPTFAPHVAYEPPPEDVVFVSVCNDKYEPGLEGVILSLRRVYPGMKNRYVVYHDEGLSAFSRARLKGLYENFEFVAADQNAFDVAMGDHHNHRRIGRLGYLSLLAIQIEGPSHVVILDSDLLILGDISPLWNGEGLRAVADVGVRPFGVVSARSGQPVINSGVLSLDASCRGPGAWALAENTLRELRKHEDPDIDHFADQRFWNVFATKVKLELLPQNFNALKALVGKYHKEELPWVSVLHITGPKPWYEFIQSDLMNEDESSALAQEKRRYGGLHVLWHEIYQRELLRTRLSNFERVMNEDFERLREKCAERPCVMIGNGPSIAKTDLSKFDGFEKFAFNWFVNHESFDTIRPDHLVVASHMLFGGWHGFRPELPAKYLEALTKHSHRPRLWFPFYFRDYLESLEALREYEKSYFFFEKPFKRPIAQVGTAQLDIKKPLRDCNTGVLTAGVPIALHLGAKNIVLVGCDSNYSSTQGSYFYASTKHASKTTSSATLLRTWEKNGEGQFGYEVTARELAKRGVAFFDATIGGKLTGIERLDIADAPSLGRVS